MAARPKLSAERGVALPLSLLVLFATSGLATLAAREAIFANRQTLRDQQVKQAAQAADAGIEAVLFRTNRIQPASQQCVVATGPGGQLAIAGLAADGWCSPQTEELGDGSSYTVRVSGARTVTANGQTLAERQVIATGISGAAKRRVMLRMNAATGAPVFALGYAVVSLGAADYGNNVRVTGGLGSNGNIYLRNSAQVCGPATPGPGKTLFLRNAASVCANQSTAATQTSFNLQPVDQGDAPVANDNARLGNPPAMYRDDACTSCEDVQWNPATRVLILRNNATLTLGGNVYSFCRIELNNSAQLNIAARASGSTRIFVDSPENCGSGSGMGSVEVRNYATFVNLNANASALQLYVVGSEEIETKVDFANGVDFQPDFVMAIFAPYSTVSVKNGVRITGAIAARSVSLQNSASVNYHQSIEDITSGSPVRLYRDEVLVECTSEPTGPTPDSGC
jgi:hypothetical protein